MEVVLIQTTKDANTQRHLAIQYHTDLELYKKIYIFY